MHKVGKQWKVVSIALLLAIGGTAVATHSSAHASETTNPVSVETTQRPSANTNNSLANEMTSVASDAQLISNIDNNMSLSEEYVNKYSAESNALSSANSQILDAEHNYAVNTYQNSSNSSTLQSAQSAKSSYLAAGNVAKANSASDASNIKNMANNSGVDLSTFQSAVNSAATSVNSNNDEMGNIGSMLSDTSFSPTNANEFKQNHDVYSVLDDEYNYYYLAGFHAGKVNIDPSTEVTTPNLVQAVSDAAVMNSYNAVTASLNNIINSATSAETSLASNTSTLNQDITNAVNTYQSMVPEYNRLRILSNYPTLSNLFGTSDVIYPTLAKILLTNSSLIHPTNNAQTLRTELLDVKSVTQGIIDLIPSALSASGIRAQMISGGGLDPNSSLSGAISSFISDLTEYVPNADMNNNILTNSNLIDINALDTGEEPNSTHTFGYLNAPLLVQELTNLSNVASELANHTDEANLIMKGYQSGLLNESDNLAAVNEINNDEAISDLNNASHNTENVTAINSLAISVNGKLTPATNNITPNSSANSSSNNTYNTSLASELGTVTSTAIEISNIDNNASVSAKYASQAEANYNTVNSASNAELSDLNKYIYATASSASNSTALSSLEASDNVENSESINAKNDVSADNITLDSLEKRYNITSSAMTSAINSAATSINSSSSYDEDNNYSVVSGSMPITTYWINDKGDSAEVESALNSFSKSYNVYSVSDMEAHQAFAYYYYINGFSAGTLSYPSDVEVPIPNLTRAVSDKAVMNSYSAENNSLNTNINSRKAQIASFNANVSSDGKLVQNDARVYQSAISNNNAERILGNKPRLSELFGSSDILYPTLAKKLLQDKTLIPSTTNTDQLRTNLQHVSSLANNLLQEIPSNISSEVISEPVIDAGTSTDGLENSDGESTIQEFIESLIGIGKDANDNENILNVNNGLIDKDAYDNGASNDNEDQNASYLNIPLLIQELSNLYTISTELSNNVNEISSIQNNTLIKGVLNPDDYALARETINKDKSISSLGNEANNSANVNALESLTSSANTTQSESTSSASSSASTSITPYNPLINFGSSAATSTVSDINKANTSSSTSTASDVNKASASSNPVVPSKSSKNNMNSKRHVSYYTKKALPLYTSLHFAKRNRVAVIKPHSNFKIVRVIRNHGQKRYEIHYRGHNYYITANKRYIGNHNYKSPKNYHYAMVNKAIELHTSANFTKHNGVMVVRPGTEFRITNVVKHHGLVRYEVRYQGHNYFITANKHYTGNAYLQKRNFRKHGYNRVRVIKPINEYRKLNFAKHSLVYRFHRGTILPVKRLITNGKRTRLELTNGRYITANKSFVNVVK